MSIKASKVKEEEIDFRKMSEAHDQRGSIESRGAFHKKELETEEPAKRQSVGKNIVSYIKKKFKSTSKDQSSTIKSQNRRLKNAQISYTKEQPSDKAEGREQL